MILVIQPMEEHARINDDILTPSEIKDLNRARAFLHDVAIRHGAPIYTGVDAIRRGVEDAVGRCNGRVDLDVKTAQDAAEDRLEMLADDDYIEDSKFM